MFVLIFCDFCGFISIAYTTLNKLLAVFYIIFLGYGRQLVNLNMVIRQLISWL